MTAFNFYLCGTYGPLRVELQTPDAVELARQIQTEKFIVGELEPDEWGEIKRVVIPSARINFVMEAGT